MEETNEMKQRYLYEQDGLTPYISKFTKSQIHKLQSCRIKTGFDNLDAMLGGGIAPGLIVLGAVSSLGKSTFALQMAQNMSAQGTVVLFFSMEMTAARVATKAISRQIFLDSGRTDEDASIEADDFMDHKKTDAFTAEAWERVEDAAKTVKKEVENLYIIEGSRNMQTGDDICEYVERWMKDDKRQIVVIIDYLQILASKDKYNISKMIVDENVRAIKQMASQFDIPVLLISSVNRENYKSPIAFESFKESGNIEYTADEVLGLQFSAVREAKRGNFDIDAEKAMYKRRVEIVALKQRYRQCNVRAEFNYYAKFDCFVERDDEENGATENSTTVKDTTTQKNERRKNTQAKEKTENVEQIEIKKDIEREKNIESTKVSDIFEGLPRRF